MIVLRRLADLLKDANSLRRVCGWAVALRWLGCVAWNGATVFRQGSLQAADKAMGNGPFRCRLGRAEAQLVGPQVMSGIREIWCRNVYLGGDLDIRDGDVVVDLGANMGNFSMLALGHGPNVRVIAVEPNRALNKLMEAQLRLNGWMSRCTIVSGFVGVPSVKTKSELDSPSGAGAEGCISFERVRALAARNVDFLKCDIEGAEFSILKAGLGWIESAGQIAMEVHFDFGSWRNIEAELVGAGFEVKLARMASRDAVFRARRKVGSIRE
jgi:FkbM family methyltransferase